MGGSYLSEEGLRIARGLVPGTYPKVLFGLNTAIGVGWETIHTASNLYTWPTSPGIISITTTNAQNTPLGTGAGYANIDGLDVNYNQIEEVVELDGLNTVTTTNEYFRVNRVCLDCVIGDAKLIGSVTATLNGQPVFDISDAYDNTALRGMYTVPAGYDAFLMETLFTQGKENQSGYVGLFVRPFGRSFRMFSAFETFQGMVINPSYFIPIKVTQKSDIEFRMRALAGSVSGSIRVSFIIVKNSTY